MAPAFNVLLAGLGASVEAYLVPVLEEAGYRADICLGREAILATLSLSLDLLLIDLPSAEELPAFTQICAASSCPVLVIGPARNERLVIATLEAGADDYVPRPIRTAELLARVRAQLRRRQRSQGIALSFGPLSLDPQGREVTYDGRPLVLSPEELALLTLLAARPGNSYPADFLTSRIWGQGREQDLSLLTSAVANLRAMIEADPARPTVLGGDTDHGFWLGGAVRERALN